MPSWYPSLARRGIHVVTPNKKFGELHSERYTKRQSKLAFAGAGPMDRIRAFHEAAGVSGSMFMAEVIIIIIIIMSVRPPSKGHYPITSTLQIGNGGRRPACSIHSAIPD